MTRNMKIIYLLNIIAVYFYFTGLFKLKQPSLKRNTVANTATYENLIFIILDGLRIDGVVKTKHDSFYHNNFAFLNSLNDKHKKIFYSISGLPTATAVRIKSIMTGAPSNFLSGSNTFTHNKVECDSFIEKIQNESFYFLGDSTWTDLFPILQNFSNTIPPYEKNISFESEEKLMEELIEKTGKYKYLLSHFIYLDYYGHNGTIYCKEIQNTMIKYDCMLKKLYNKMSEDTLMVVMSDHGVNDDGSHGGGSIHEISSTGVFLSKKEFKAHQDEYIATVRNKFIKKLYDNSTEWVKADDELVVIHQNDIMTTMCVLMCVPIPFNCYGNLIYEIIGNQEKIYQNLLKQKYELLNLKYKDYLGDIKEVIEKNYQASEKIFDELSGKDLKRLCLSFVLILSSLIYQHLKMGTVKVYNFKTVCSIFSVLMIAHSIYSFIHEDLIWATHFLIQQPVLETFLILFVLLVIGKYPQHEEDRWIKFQKVNSYYQENGRSFINLVITYYLCHYLVCLYKKSKRRSILFYIKENLMKRDLFLIILKYYLKEKFKTNSHEIIFCDLSLRTLSFLIFDPPTLFFIHIVLNKMKITSSEQLLAINNLSVFYIGINYVMSSIRYDITYVFYNDMNVILNSIMILFFLMYPRYLNSKFRFEALYIWLITFYMLCVMVIGCWFADDLLFYYFFGEKTFFIGFFFVIDNIIMIIYN